MAIVLALMAIAGSWVAWRHNPLYSPRSTLRMLVALALLIAAALLVIAKTVNLTSGRSEGVQLGVMLAVVAALALAMIFAIQAVTVPKAARMTTTLPPDAKVLSVFRQSFYHWARAYLVFMAACGLLCLVLPGTAKFMVLALAGVSLLIGVVLLPVLYVMDRRFDRSLTAIELDPWVHWQYPAAQWQEWTAILVERARVMPSTLGWKQHRALLWGVCAAMIGTSLVLATGSLIARLSYGIFCCAALALLIEFAAWEARRAPDKLRAKLAQVVPEAYFGHDGLYCNGMFVTWMDMSVHLISASIDTRQPRSLVFCFDKFVFNPYGATQTIRIRQSVLVPADGDRDIARLQKELTQRCPSAQVALA